MAIPISVLILTKDEENDLPGCLESCSWSDDVVVFDSFSTDATVSIAESWGARLFQRAFDDERIHRTASLQVGFRHRWVLCLDADERVLPDLADEMHRAVASSGANVAYRMRRKDYFRGTWLKHATFYPTWLVRLFRPEFVRFERSVNLATIVDGPVGQLSGHIEHYPFSKGISHWVGRHNRYSSLEASEYLNADVIPLRHVLSSDPGQRRRALKYQFSRMPLRPTLKFLYLYFARLGFLDGRPGFDYAMLQAIYEYFISLKICEMKGRPAIARTPASAGMSGTGLPMALDPSQRERV